MLPFLLVVAAGGFAVYRAEKDSDARNAAENLSSIARIKTSQIEAWLAHGRKDAQMAIASPSFAADLRAWLAGGRRDEGLRQRLLQRLEPLLFDHSRATLRSGMDGALLLAATAEGDEGEDDSAETRAQAMAAARSDAPLLDGPYLAGSDDRRHMEVALRVPIAAGGAKPIAVLSLALDPERELFPLLQEWPGTSPSAEVLLVRPEGDDIVYLNGPRHRSQVLPNLHLPRTTPDLLAAKAIEGVTGGIQGVDYRQVPSLGYATPVAGTPWFLVAKIDQAEVFANVDGLARISAATLAFLLLAAVWWLAERWANEARFEHLSRLYAALSAVNDSIARSETIEEVLRATCRACIDQGGFKLAWIGQPDADGQHIVVREAHAAGPELAYLEGARVDLSADTPQGRGPTAIAFREQRPFVCKDFQRDPATAPWREKAARYGLRSSIALPIVLDGVARGVLTTYSGRVGTFDREAEGVLGEIASTLSFAMRHFIDEAHKRQLAAALREGEARLQEAQAIAKVGHWNIDLESGAMFWSPQLYRLFERDPAKGPADLQALADYYLPASFRQTEDGLRHAIKTGERVVLEQQLRLPGQRIVHHAAVIVPTRDANGWTIALHGTVQDITEHKLNEEILIQAAEQLERAAREVADLYENAPCGYHSIDGAGIFRRINATELKWLGYRAEEVIGKLRLVDLLTPASVPIFQRTFPRFKESGEVRDLEIELVRKDGTTMPVLISATALRDAHGRFLVSRSTVYDMSERKKMERERADYAQRLEEMSRHLVAVQEDARRRLSGELHDRTSPNLAAIAINLGVVAAALPADKFPELASRLEDTQALIEDTTVSIRDICADLSPPVLDYAGLLPALEGYAHQFSKRTGATVHVQAGNATGRLAPAVESLLFRIVQEALTNCAKHSHASSIMVALNVEEGSIVLTVTDDGVGFAPAMLGRAGHVPGLGLLNMRRMAEFAGGRCDIESRPGEGTRIRVEI